MDATTTAQPEAQRATPIALGRSDYVSVLLRLVGMDVYKVRRRRLSLVMLIVGTLIATLIILGIGVAEVVLANEPVTNFTPSNCANYPHPFPGCINHPPTLADHQHEKARTLQSGANLLNVPGVWNVEETFDIQILCVLGIILAGTLVGGEYSLGVVRLMFTRGPTRVQFLLAKIVTLALYVIPVVLVWMLLGMIIGDVMAHAAGIGVDLSYFTTDAHVGHFILFMLLGMLYWFAYMLMALFFGVLGRSTVAAIVGPLIWLGMEPILSNIMVTLADFGTGNVAQFFKHVPDYFLGNNLSSLLQAQMFALAPADPAPYSNKHSLLVVAVYLIVFVGVACVLTVRRDVTQ